jgi:hypothetical protein
MEAAMDKSRVGRHWKPWRAPNNNREFVTKDEFEIAELISEHIIEDFPS